jgi:predicted enzyme involved in methoxymalonyl-ACP biosynthesis
MKIQAELSMTDTIEVKATDNRYTQFVIRLGDIELEISRAKMEALFQLVEENLYDEDSWSRNLENENDKLKMRVDELAEYIENYGYEVPA